MSPYLIHLLEVQHPKGMFITGHFTCITDNVVNYLTCDKCPTTVYIEETGRRMADRFRENRRDVMNERNYLPVPAHFNQPNHTLEVMKVAVLKADLANQEYRKKQEMRFIFWEGAMTRVVLIKTSVLVNSFFAHSRAGARCHVREHVIRHAINLTNFLTVFSYSFVP